MRYYMYEQEDRILFSQIQLPEKQFIRRNGKYTRLDAIYKVTGVILPANKTVREIKEFVRDHIYGKPALWKDYQNCMRSYLKLGALREVTNTLVAIFNISFEKRDPSERETAILDPFFKGMEQGRFHGFKLERENVYAEFE